MPPNHARSVMNPHGEVGHIFCLLLLLAYDLFEKFDSFLVSKKYPKVPLDYLGFCFLKRPRCHIRQFLCFGKPGLRCPSRIWHAAHDTLECRTLLLESVGSRHELSAIWAFTYSVQTTHAAFISALSALFTTVTMTLNECCTVGVCPFP